MQFLCKEQHNLTGMECPTFFLKQGGYYVSDRGPALVTTILGSCVTVTMHCPVLRIGGITHSLLPYPLPGMEISNEHHGRFVNVSVRNIFERLVSLGVKQNSMEVKIFGGGQTFWPPFEKTSDKGISVGRRNVETALMVIHELGLGITATDVGGSRGRQLIFLPHSGDVWVKKIGRFANRRVENQIQMCRPAHAVDADGSLGHRFDGEKRTYREVVADS